MEFATMQELLDHYRGRPLELIETIRTKVLGAVADGYDEPAVLLAVRMKYQGSGTREQAEHDFELLKSTGDLPLCCGRYLLSR